MATQASEYVVFLRGPQSSLPTRAQDMSTSTVYFANDIGLIYFLLSNNTIARFYANDSSVNPFTYDTVNNSVMQRNGDASNVASGKDSFAVGKGSRAVGAAELACGLFNVSDASNVFSVGYGTSDASRATAFAVHSNGDAFYKSDLLEDIFSNILTSAISIACSGSGTIKYMNVAGNNVSVPIASMAPSLQPKSVYYVDAASVTSIANMFKNCATLQTCSFNGSPMAAVTDIQHAFNGDTSLTSITGYDYAAVTNASNAFANCDSITDITDVVPSGCAFANLVNATSMFTLCDNLTDMSALSTWLFGSNADITGMFSYCNKLSTIDIRDFPVNIRKADEAFSYRSNASSILVDASTFEKLTSCVGMFRSCNAVSMKTDSAYILFDSSVNASSMFRDCSAVTVTDTMVFSNNCNVDYMMAGSSSSKVNNIKMSGITFNGNASAKYMFRDSNSVALSNITVTGQCDFTGAFTNDDAIDFSMSVDLSNASNVKLDYLFDNCPCINGSAVTLMGSNWKGIATAVTSSEGMFRGCAALTDFGVFNSKGISFSACSNAKGMFSGSGLNNAVSLKDFFGASKSVNICQMFKDTSITSFSVDTQMSASDTAGMFSGCDSLVRVSNMGNMDTAGVAACYDMFRGCSSLYDADFTNCTFPNAVDFSGMFANCVALKTLVQAFNSQHVMNSSEMFLNCKEFTTLRIPFLLEPSKKNVDCHGMFMGCTQLKSVQFDAANSAYAGVTTDTRNMFNGCASLDTIVNPVRIRLSDSSSATGMFTGCSMLTTITAPSTWSISSDDSSYEVDFSPCTKLTVASMDAIVNALLKNGTAGKIYFSSSSQALYDNAHGGTGALANDVTAKLWTLKIK